MITNPSCQTESKTETDSKFHPGHFDDELGDIGPGGGQSVPPGGLADHTGYGHYGGHHGAGHYNGHYYNSWSGHQTPDYNNYYSGHAPGSGGHNLVTTQSGQYYAGSGPPQHHYSHAPAPGLQYHQVSYYLHINQNNL